MFFLRFRVFVLFALVVVVSASHGGSSFAKGSTHPAKGTGQLALRGNTTAIVVEDRTGRVIYARRADTRFYPASLTKVMTLYLLFESIKGRKLRLNSPIRVSAYAASAPSTRLGLRPGEYISVQDAIFALITRSANDVAIAVAERLASTEEQFARTMTRRAYQIGMRHTHFQNASGLPNAQQVTTARDMAILARRIRHDFPDYYRYFSTHSFIWRGEVVTTHNHLLKKYHGATGLKTGYTSKSGYNLITIAERKNRVLIGVVTGSDTSAGRDEEMMRMLDQHFGSHLKKTKGTAKIKSQRCARKKAARKGDHPQGGSKKRPIAKGTNGHGRRG